MIRYSYVSIALIVTGTLITLMSLLALYSSPVLVFGISLIPIGLLLLWSESSGNDEIIKIYDSWNNLALLLEDLGTIRRAIYLPSSRTEANKPMAILPLTYTMELGDAKVPMKFSVRYGESSVGILIHTPGTNVVELCREGGALGKGDISSSLTTCLVNHLSLVKKVVVQEVEDGLRIEVINPRLSNIYENTIVEKVIGSPIASAIAGVVAEVLDKPMIINKEERDGDRVIVYLVNALGGRNVP
ncbi:MAG: hypothetical protein ACP5NQ_01000 [Vulcanisaeta sp.]